MAFTRPMDDDTPVASSGWQPPSDDGYDDFLAAVHKRFAELSSQDKPPPLFTVAAEDLYDVYLAALPESLRQEHNCSMCRRFVTRFGGLVTIDARGKTSPVLWSAKQGRDPYASAARALVDTISRAPVVGVFMSSERAWGKPRTGVWPHLSVKPTNALVFSNKGTRNAEQAAAEKREDVNTLRAALNDYSLELVKRAASLLETGKLFRSEKCISVAKWLLGVHKSLKGAGSARTRENLIWSFVATAPPGFCHVRSSMIGSLLDDLANELSFDEIKARFDAKMDPTKYQRPTAPPGEQNIQRAETIFAKLRSAGALERRFATLADIETLWRPASAKKPKREGIFANVKARSKTRPITPIDAPPVVMTWEKFARTVLPEAAQIHYHVPAAPKAYTALVTAKNPDAPPIIQWDSETKRNPVTWYMYVKGSLPDQWNLRADTHHPVTAITLTPSMWGGSDRFPHHGKGVLFVLEGAKDLRHKGGGGLFPEDLRNEYREVRATIEAYAKTALIDGRDQAEACGIAMTASGGSWGHTFSVTDTDGAVVTYQLDRWD